MDSTNYFGSVTVTMEVVQSITVNFIKDGSIVGTTAVGDGMYIAGTVSVSKSGYTFAGWYYDQAGDEPFVASEKVLASNTHVNDLTLNLYAKFIPAS